MDGKDRQTDGGRQMEKVGGEGRWVGKMDGSGRQTDGKNRWKRWMEKADGWMGKAGG